MNDTFNYLKIISDRLDSMMAPIIKYMNKINPFYRDKNSIYDYFKEKKFVHIFNDNGEDKAIIITKCYALYEEFFHIKLINFSILKNKYYYINKNMFNNNRYHIMDKKILKDFVDNKLTKSEYEEISAVLLTPNLDFNIHTNTFKFIKQKKDFNIHEIQKNNELYIESLTDLTGSIDGVKMFFNETNKNGSILFTDNNVNKIISVNQLEMAVEVGLLYPSINNIASYPTTIFAVLNFDILKEKFKNLDMEEFSSTKIYSKEFSKGFECGNYNKIYCNFYLKRLATIDGDCIHIGVDFKTDPNFTITKNYSILLSFREFENLRKLILEIDKKE